MTIVKRVPNDSIAVVDGEIEIISDDNPLWINVNRAEGISILKEEVEVNGHTIPPGAVLVLLINDQSHVIFFPDWEDSDLAYWVNT